MTVYNRNRTNPTKRPNWWIQYQAQGERVREAGGPTRKAAEAYEAAQLRALKRGTWVHPKRRGQANTFAQYAPDVIRRRAARGVKTAAKDEAGHVENHLIPLFGPMPVSALTFQVIRKGFQQLQDKGLAPRTVRNVHATLRSVLVEAVEDELITILPQPLTANRGHLPRPVDANPLFRDAAVFSRDEVATLLGCPAVPPDRRTMYATLLLTGARLGEVLALRWSDFEGWHDGLARLVIPAEKTGRTKGAAFRLVPVHPDLRGWLDWWRDEGTEQTLGLAPAPTGLLFPTTSARRMNAGLDARSQSEAYKRWSVHDLPAAGLRHRRIHDTRRTFVSVARSSRVQSEVVRAFTHRAVRDRVLEAYTTFEWEALCREMKEVQWRIPGPPGTGGVVLEMQGRRKP